MATLTATRPIFRASLRSAQANGHAVFIPQCRKIVFEYCDKWPSSANTRTFLLKHLRSVAEENPHVELVVRQRNHKEPIARGFYINDRDKVVPLNGFEVNGIQKKVQLLLDSSGAKIKPLKRRTIESTTESARGIWSGLHVDELFKI
ncbi:thioredoxin-like protein [Thelephora terrestris]|uniref:Large ribosomal subunit protein mL43 n=1 Tax=Thelephora terrestris TaxID=56493 RepID=A0A9P6L6Y5_9AGAM|nr:thioredoxin-like protein [Thelephora terrestris]